MRPSDLNPLFAEASGLHGVGPKMAALLDRLLAPPGRAARVLDLLFHRPTEVIDRRGRPKIIDAPRDCVVTLNVRVREHQPPAPNRRGPHRVIVEDETGDVTLVFFLNNTGWIEKALPVGAMRLVSGKLELYDGRLQMVHPDRVLDAEEAARLPAVEPVYPSTEGLSPRVLGRAIAAALERLPEIAEWLDPHVVVLRGWPDFRGALASLHQPAAPEALDADSPAAQRLAYDEFLAEQLALGLVRRAQRAGKKGRARLADGRIADRILAALPYRLTEGQDAALAEIRADLAAPKRMLRLLQGDVGSGKTVVALLAAASVVEAGCQAAMMVPTEVLARQHGARIAPLAAAAGLRIAVLTGRDRPAERSATQAALEAGGIDLVIGTHALFSEALRFRDLGLVIVDEQHRFGVAQRLALADKGVAADLLVMTATPIPRTLVLTLFGDMDVSILREKPAGRKPIATIAKPIEQLGEVVAAIGRALAQGARVYWVCPLVTESEHIDLVAAEDRFTHLGRCFAGQVSLVHGQMKPAERDAAIEAFAAGATPILVATTVIEVGIDVPDATIMVIEHAERFGLAQLHQLRGRVGRGEARSTCLLLYRGPLGPAAFARLKILRETEDGFRIADEDLRLRGEGELIGTKQSGLPTFRMARLEQHGTLLEEARAEARSIVETDPDLTGLRGPALRRLLYLFERDSAVRLLAGG